MDTQLQGILNEKEAAILLNALQTSQPHAILASRAYQLSEQPTEDTDTVLLYILRMTTRADRATIHRTNATYVQHLLEMRPELELLYHGHDLYDWREALADQLALEGSIRAAALAETRSQTQVFLFAWKVNDTLALLYDIAEAIAYVVCDSDDHQVIVRYAQRVPYEPSEPTEK